MNMVHQELTDKYRGRRYQLEDSVLTVSHVIQVDGEGGPYYEVIYNRYPPQPNSTGTGSCWLDVLLGLVEIR